MGRFGQDRGVVEVGEFIVVQRTGFSLLIHKLRLQSHVGEVEGLSATNRQACAGRQTQSSFAARAAFFGVDVNGVQLHVVVDATGGSIELHACVGGIGHRHGRAEHLRHKARGAGVADVVRQRQRHVVDEKRSRSKASRKNGRHP